MGRNLQEFETKGVVKTRHLEKNGRNLTPFFFTTSTSQLFLSITLELNNNFRPNVVSLKCTIRVRKKNVSTEEN